MSRREDSPLSSGPPSSHRSARSVPSARRWWSLSQLALMSFGNASAWLTPVVVRTEAETYFHGSSAVMQVTAAIYSIVFIVAAFPVASFVLRYGLLRTLRVASLCNVLGMTLRLVSAIWFPSYIALIGAQVLMGVTFTVALIVPPHFAAVWFSSERRLMATAGGAMPNYLGQAAGIVLPVVIIAHQSNGPVQWATLFGIQLGMAVVDFAVAMLLADDEPEEAPSRAATFFREAREADSNSRDTMQQILRENTAIIDGEGTEEATTLMAIRPRTVQESIEFLAKRTDFSMLCIACGLFLGMSWGQFALIAALFKPFHLSVAPRTTMTFASLLFGAVLAFPIAWWVGRSQRHRLFLIGAFGVVSFLGVALVGALNTKIAHFTNVVAALYIVSGVVQSTTVPVIMDLASDMGFPATAAAANTVVMWTANLGSSIAVFAFAFMVTKNSASSSIAILAVAAGMATVATVVLVLLRQHLHRAAFEREDAIYILHPQDVEMRRLQESRVQDTYGTLL